MNVDYKLYVKKFSIGDFNQLTLIAFIVFIGILRLFIIGRGAASIPDETRYWHGFYGCYEILNGHIKSGVSFFFELGARPFLPIIHFPQYFMQSIIKLLFGLDPRSVQSLYFAQSINVFASILILFYFYKLLIYWLQINHTVALLFSGLFAVLLDSNLFLRHLLPYDLVLLLWLILYYHLRHWNFRVVGILITCITLAYPGYWPMAFIAISICLYSFYVKHKTINQVLNFWIYCGALILPLVFVLLISRLFGLIFLDEFLQAGHNYLYELNLPNRGTVYSFIIYYFEQDSLFGLSILCFGSLGIVAIIYKSIKSTSLSELTVIAFTILFVLLLISLVGASINQKMLYGRMIKQFSPFLVLFACWVYSQMDSFMKYKWATHCIIFLVIVIKFIMVINDLNKVFYPRDLLHQYETSEAKADFSYNILDQNCTHILNDFRMSYCFTVPPNSNTNHFGKKFKFVNFGIPDCYDSQWNFVSNGIKDKLIFAGMHYYAYPPYTLDWIPKVQMDEEQKLLQLKIYEQKAN